MNLFEHFACHTQLPVRLKDVTEHILGTGVVATIKFVPSELNIQTIQGFLRVSHWKPPYGADGAHAQIFYAKALPLTLRRLVVDKELIHILDDHQETAQTRAAVDQLISEIVVPLALTASIPGTSDHLTILRALCILMPRDALVVLRDLHKDKRLNTEAIARLALIPESYVDFLLSPQWEKVVESIT
jgi:hypothetical protein